MELTFTTHQTYFQNAKVVADRFYFTRYATEAVDTVRKQIQEKLSRSEKKYFKHSRKLLLSKYSNLKTEKQKEELKYYIQMDQWKDITR